VSTLTDPLAEAVRLERFGTQVIKTGQTFPQGGPGTSALFTVAGGRCLITALFGIVTTVIAGTDPQLTLGTAPTGGTAETAGIASSTALTSAEAGTLITVQSSSGEPGALVVMASPAKAGNAVYLHSTGFLVSPGTITQTAQAAETGAVSWYLTYIPMDDGAAVS
jgi:hypothetical protein